MENTTNPQLVPIETLKTGDVCLHTKKTNLLMGWAPNNREQLFNGLEEEEEFFGDAIVYRETTKTFLLILGDPVNVHSHVCVPVMFGTGEVGWIFSRTLVKLIA